MKNFILLIAITIISQTAKAEDPMLELEFDDPFEGMDPPILDFDKPKTEPRKVNPITDDEYCLCRCMKTTDVKSRTRFFKGKRDGKACLCECLVK